MAPDMQQPVTGRLNCLSLRRSFRWTAAFRQLWKNWSRLSAVERKGRVWPGLISSRPDLQLCNLGNGDVSDETLAFGSDGSRSAAVVRSDGSGPDHAAHRARGRP